jgi:putative ABC transport system permease protein
VDARYSMTDNLPITHLYAVRDLPGVATATPMVWFGGYFREPANAFSKIPVDHEAFFDVYPELEVSDDTRRRFAESRRAVVVADTLAAQFGWQVGDVIPIRADIWPKADATWDWEFALAGTYSVPDGSRVQPMFLIRYDFFTDSVADWVKYQIGWMVVRVADQADPVQVMAAIDGLFDNSADPTEALSEDAYTRQFASELADMVATTTLILGAVFFTILLLTGNVVSMAFRERVPELAVLKTLGFKDHSVAGLVLAEALLLCLVGAAAGVALGFACADVLNDFLAGVLGTVRMRWVDAGHAALIAVALSLVIGVPPALAARRLSIVGALRGGV